MQRRDLLRGVFALTASTGLAGCGSLVDTPTARDTTPATASASGPETDAMPTPYRAADTEGNLYRARSITVTNKRATPQYVTVAIDEADRQVVVRSATVPAGRSLTHFGLVAKRGVYRLTVDTASGASAVREFVVHEGVSDLTVVVGDGSVVTRQDARCWPECPPLSQGGFVGAFPRPETTVRWRGLGQVLVRNVDSRARAVRIRLWTADTETAERLLDYRYRVPAGLRLVLPLVSRGGRYELAVDADTDGSADGTRRVWHVPEESVAEFTVGAGVTTVCDVIRGRADGTYGPFRLGGIRNDDDVSHTVTVDVAHDGGQFSEAVDVPAGERVDVGFQASAGDSVRLTARTDAGAELVATWTHCPPAGFLVLTIDSRGRLRGYSDRQGLVAE